MNKTSEAPRLAPSEQTRYLAAYEAKVSGLRITLGACCTNPDRVTEATVELVVIDASRTDCRMVELVAGCSQRMASK